MENFNHLNSEYYGLPTYGYKRTTNTSEKQSTLLAIGVVIVFTIIALVVA